MVVGADQVSDVAVAETRDRILDGALRVIGSDGIHSISMRKIAEAAEVARGTVYHYFNNTGEVLRAVSSYDQRRFDEGATQVLAGVTDPEKQLRAFLKFCYRYLTLHPTRWMVENEPHFLLRYLDEQMPYMSARFEKTLGHILADSPAVQMKRLTSAQLADLAVRTLVSAYLLPAGDPETPVNAIAELILLPLDTKKRSTPITRRQAEGKPVNRARKQGSGNGRPR
jgi:AcrR family transcriptional regulator